jgi:hypothetical protein
MSYMWIRPRANSTKRMQKTCRQAADAEIERGPYSEGVGRLTC